MKFFLNISFLGFSGEMLKIILLANPNVPKKIVTKKLLKIVFEMFCESAPWAQGYRTNCRIKFLCKMEFFTPKSEFSKLLCYKKIYSENESKIKIISCTDFFYNVIRRVKLF